MPAAPIHHTATVDTPWDGAAAEKAFDKKPGDFPKFYAWIDEGESDKDADGTDKEDGWGPHHEVDSDGVPGAANVNGVHAAVAALNGAHGTTSRIPDSDRQGVFDHLVAHLKDAGVKDADLPEFKSAKPAAPALVGRRKQRQSRTLSPGREFRRFAARGLEVRSAADGSDTIEITGFPIMYDAPYAVCDMFGEFEETMHAGVVTNVLAAQPDVRFLFNHDGMPLARTLAGTLTLNDTATALGMTARLDARQQLANDLAVAIERGDVTQMSCGFVVGMDTWNSDYTQRDIWRLSDLFDVSAVTYPASPTTSIELALRSMMAAPIESRARLRTVWKAAREAREGKVLSAENAGLLQQALDALHEADDVDIPAIVTSLQTIDAALDAGQAGLASVLGKANPDGDPDDRNPELTDDDDDEGEESPDQQDGTEGGTDGVPPGLADATGSRSRVPGSRQERRDADRSFNDIEQAVSDALTAKYGPGDDAWFDLWLVDCGETWCVFHSYETSPGIGLWRVSYVLDPDTGAATISDDAVQVVEQTTYVPAQRARNVALELEAEALRLRRRHIAA